MTEITIRLDDFKQYISLKLTYIIIVSLISSTFLPNIIELFLITDTNIIRLTLLMDFLIICAISFFKLRPSFQQFFLKRNTFYRESVVAFLIFLFFFVILNSSLLMYIQTRMDIYGFFLKPNTSFIYPARWNLIINTIIAGVASLLFHFLNRLLIKRYGTIRKTPLFASTFLLALAPVGIGLIPLVFFVEAGFFLFVMVAMFPFILALLAILGYSHPQNKLNPISAILLFIVATIFCIFGFTIAMIGLRWFLSGTIPYSPPPQTWRTFFSFSTNPIDWSRLTYPMADYLPLWKTGFTAMVLFNIFFMELGPGFITVLTIFPYQLIRVKRLKKE